MVSKLCATVANASPNGRRQPARIFDFLDDKDDIGKPGGVQRQKPADVLAKLDAYSASHGLNNAAEEAIILGIRNGSDTR
jgi:hypothetical protein